MKILILVMSHKTDDVNFKTFKEIWDRTIEKIKQKNLPIDILFLYTDLNINQEYVVDNNKLVSKCEENYWYSLLIKVLNGFDFSLKNGYDLTFKTNLSTLLNIDEFYKHCLNSSDKEDVYDGIVGHYKGFSFCSGAGMLLNKKMIETVLHNKSLVTSEWTDDIFIGYILNKKYQINPNKGNMSRYDIVTKEKKLDENRILNSTHIRIKIRISDYDSEISKKVYEILYTR